MPQSRPTKHSPPAAALRPPTEVMRLANMGACFPSRLSFSRVLIRRLAQAGAQVVRRHWDINDDGYGCAVYSTNLDGNDYSLIAFSTPLADDQRSDRVIATAWDTTYVLYDGIPTNEALRRLEANVPKQEAGRYDEDTLILSRANKSVRLFQHVAGRLAGGEQPDVQKIIDTGYLMRTTAVYGNGKFGIADRSRVMSRPSFASPFQAELLTVWLIRGFTQDLVEHIAKQKGGARAAKISPCLRRYFGVGNSTGLGMAPFLINHPVLIHHWATARETALARVCAIKQATAETHERLQNLAARAGGHLSQWRVADCRQAARLALLRREWKIIRRLLSEAPPAYPWQRLLAQAQAHSAECRELLVSLLLEPHADLIDELTNNMATDITPVLQPDMQVGQLRDLLAHHFALAVDFSAPRATHRLWYVAQEKLEPRVGARSTLPDATELPMNVAWQVRQLFDGLAGAPTKQTLAEFLAGKPQYRHATRRVQMFADYPYAEIRDNLIDKNSLPIDLLRWKLSFLGATKFDPKSDLWVRIVLFQGAPCLDDITGGDADDWWLPVMEAAA